MTRKQVSLTVAPGGVGKSLTLVEALCLASGRRLLDEWIEPVADLAGGRVADYGLIATAGVIAALPPVLFGLVMQRTLISGLTTGSVKG